MSDKRTETSFRAAQDARDARQEVTGGRLKRCIASTETCITRAAFKLGLSETFFRKVRAGDAHFAMHDFEGLAVHEPALFDALLSELAALRGRIVVEAAPGESVADQLNQVASVAKEAGEAVATLAAAVASNDPAARLAAIREGKEAVCAITASVVSLERKQSEHVAAVTRPRAPNAPGGAA